jgi:ubiquinone/menaquinone biosynthesis C-methylase UbiE
MENKVLDVFCDPKSHKSLKQHGLVLETDDGKSFPIQNDIPVFIKPKDVVALNLKYQRFYDTIARWYDWVIWFYKIFRPQGFAERNKLLKDLIIKPGMKVLETSIGTGFNLTLFTKEAEYYGIDISMGMLRVCQRENKKMGYKLHIAQANAEELPLKDVVFDVVFHVGGINFFNNIPGAINEMIRVAKPGAQILISDETQEHVVKAYQRWPFVRRFFKEAKPVVVPMEFIPKDMKDVNLRYAEDKRMYVITFRKP